MMWCRVGDSVGYVTVVWTGLPLGLAAQGRGAFVLVGTMLPAAGGGGVSGF